MGVPDGVGGGKQGHVASFSSAQHTALGSSSPRPPARLPPRLHVPPPAAPTGAGRARAAIGGLCSQKPPPRRYTSAVVHSQTTKQMVRGSSFVNQTNS